MPGPLPPGYMPAGGPVHRTSVQCHCNDRKSPGDQHASGIPPTHRRWRAAQIHHALQSDQGNLLLSC